ncbi:hypothetical protein [Sutcliffiella horikoshii]|uniref:hypothetical protein n=1 Tax=Sutcliffiella horikoshii TaxID=79883 RepID=UPI001F1BD591|nr:hypothetical protein [Sutcliffiella horikoshii]MCG1021480.1 hypothetical protein [Sutcliffiella horikoshii]
MGQQMSFILDEETEMDFFDFLVREAGCKVLFEGVHSLPVEVSELPHPFSSKGWFKVYAYKESLGNYQLEELTNGRKIMNAISSPVIEFSRTTIREMDVSKGRLWVETKYYDDNQLIQKPTELKELYKECCKWIRGRTKRLDVEINGFISKEYVSLKLEKGRVLPFLKFF